MSETIEEMRRSRDHQRERVKHVKTARNRNADGLAYWRERAMAAEAKLGGEQRERYTSGDSIDISAELLVALHGYTNHEDADISFLRAELGIDFSPDQVSSIKSFRKQLWCAATQEGWRAISKRS